LREKILKTGTEKKEAQLIRSVTEETLELTLLNKKD
jgi:hypothetical protein